MTAYDCTTNTSSLHRPCKADCRDDYKRRFEVKQYSWKYWSTSSDSSADDLRTETETETLAGNGNLECRNTKLYRNASSLNRLDQALLSAATSLVLPREIHAAITIYVIRNV